MRRGVSSGDIRNVSDMGSPQRFISARLPTSKDFADGRIHAPRIMSRELDASKLKEMKKAEKKEKKRRDKAKKVRNILFTVSWASNFINFFPHFRN